MTAFLRVDRQETTGISYMSITKHSGQRRTFVCEFSRRKKREKRERQNQEREKQVRKDRATLARRLDRDVQSLVLNVRR